MTTSSVERVRELHLKAVATAAGADPAEAARLLRQALRSLPVVRSVDAELISLRTKVLTSLALAEAETGSMADGLVHLDSAEALLGGLPRGPGRAALRGLVHQQRALVLLRGGHTDNAIALFDSAIPLLERALAGGAGEAVVLVRTCMNRGLAHLTAGRPGPAARDLDRCLVLAEEQQLPVLEAKARHNLGDLAQLTGDVPSALRHYQRAELIYARRAPGMLSRLRIDQARALLAAGLADEAARHVDEALPELRRNRVGEDIAEAELVRAEAALLAGEPQLAAPLASSARKRLLRRGNRALAEVAALTRMRATGGSAQRVAELAVRLDALGLADEAQLALLLGVRLALRRGRLAEADALMLQTSRPRRTTPLDHRLLLRLCRAELAAARGDDRKALAQARFGLDELGKLRDRMGGLDLVCGTAVHGMELSSLAVRLVARRARTDSDARRLLDWQERTRAQVYRYEPLPVADDDVLAAKVAEVRTLMRAIRAARLDGRSATALEHRCARVQQDVSRLGWRAARWLRPRPVCGHTEVADALGARTLLSFSCQGNELLAVVVRGGRTRLARLGDAASVIEVARQLSADLNALAPRQLPAPLAEAVAASASRRARRLDALLFDPLAGLLGDDNLVVVPTGQLHTVPWSTLPSLHGRGLTVAPSATAWVIADRALAKPRDNRAVLVGGPGLPQAIAELDHLTELYPDSVVLQGSDATTEAVLAALDGAALAHVAAHGNHEPANALFSRLELVNGPLLAHEIKRIDQAPRHLVLAACELALAHIRPGDEPLGFAGAMLAAGSHTVVAAVSRVGDDAAADTMTAYHRRLLTGDSPAVALATAVAEDPLRRPFVCLGAG